MNRTIITVMGKDTVGIIAHTCTLLAKKGVNILDISQTITGGIFNMIMIVDASSVETEFDQFTSDLQDLGNELGVHVFCQKEEIFDMMHRI